MMSSQAVLLVLSQSSNCRVPKPGLTLDQTKSSLNTVRQQKQQIQDQLHHGNKEVDRLQQELTHVLCTTEKRVIGFFLKVCIQILNYEFF